MDEVKEQQEAARRFEGAIGELEPLLHQSSRGQFSFEKADLEKVTVDPDDLKQLLASVEDLNSSLSDGLLALKDIHTKTPGVARA
jgi:hypothetical protein